MSLIRPEIRAELWRARELCAGITLAIVFFLGAAGSFALTRWIAITLGFSGLALAFTGWQRRQLRPKIPALGLIEADEGCITYWGPLDGGRVDRDRITALTIDHASVPPNWILSHQDGPDLHIPVTADGQDALLDALNSLPGLSATRLLAAKNHKIDGRHRLWSVSRIG